MQRCQMGGQGMWDVSGPPSRPQQLQPAGFEQDLNVCPASVAVLRARCDSDVSIPHHTRQSAGELISLPLSAAGTAPSVFSTCTLTLTKISRLCGSMRL